MLRPPAAPVRPGLRRPPRPSGLYRPGLHQQPPGGYRPGLYQPGMPGQPMHPGMMPGGYMGMPRRRSRLHWLYQNRRFLPPFAWALAVAGTAGGLHTDHAPMVADILTGVVACGLIVLGTRHLKSNFAQNWSLACAGCTLACLPVLAILGAKPWAVLPIGSLIVLAPAWVLHYRIRPPEPEQPPPPGGPTGDEKTWLDLAEYKKWVATLGDAEKIPNGKRYPVQCDGITTHIGKLMGEPIAVAAAFHKPITEAYIEPSHDGVASRGSLTILKQGTLQQVRHWNGKGATPEGLAVIGRFADGADAHMRLFAPRDGARHSLIAGTTGSGKSALLDLLVRIYLTSGIFPVILDPQNGQSLPEWRGRVPYAAGVEECMELLTLLHEAMMDRSRRLSQMEWVKHGRTIQGMKFFDADLCGMPLVRGIFEEHPILLTDARWGLDAAKMTGEIGKLGRKAGIGEDVVAQVPSLAELIDQVVRSMLVGGNVIALRTGDKQSAGMIGLPADPHDLPRVFADMTPTYGLGYVLGPDNRQAIARTDIPTEEQEAADYVLPALEPEFAAILGRFGKQVFAHPAAEVDEAPAPNGKTAADAILEVLTESMERGEILERASQKAVEWGREPWSLRGVTQPLEQLVKDGRVTRTERGKYAPVAGKDAA